MCFGGSEMSDTPETDENISVGLENADRECVPVDFSRKLERERDEARAALMKIEDLFIDGTDIYADKEKMGIIARAALEDEARAELDAHREAGHLCDSHRDMMGDCIVCSMEEKNERVLRG
jgi:hypothetical protein